MERLTSVHERSIAKPFKPFNSDGFCFLNKYLKYFGVREFSYFQNIFFFSILKHPYDLKKKKKKKLYDL